MKTIDWRELYASNRATIKRAGIDPGTLPTSYEARPLPSMPSLASFAAAPAVPAPGGTLRSFDVAGGSRRALVHVPAGLPTQTAVPLVCMLHGCTQDAASFAAATQMNRAADRHGFVVVYPEQQRSDNPQGCWNWFERAHHGRGAGEPRVIAEIVEALLAPSDEFTADPARVFVAGLSAGGAMAAILAAAYPDVFAAVAVHSGLPYGAATSMGSAFAAMAGGGEVDAGSADRMLAAMGPHARPVPTIVVHGTADRTVAPANGEHVLVQSLAATRLAVPAAGPLDVAHPTTVAHGRVEGGHAYTTRRWEDTSGLLCHEALTVEGMGHAWSGGAAGGSFTDPRGPDATEAMLAFFAAVTARR